MSATLSSFTCTFKPNYVKPKSARTHKNPSTIKPIPARDRVIDFGKHKGKMLGSLPSTYLKWVSKNLRAGDIEPWARLADQVLQDPVYQDRVEWEFAENVLNGTKKVPSLSGTDGNGVVSELLEISERFGWDNEDKVGWSEVKFEFLGTSKGGRIPRKSWPSSFSRNGGGEGLNVEERKVVEEVGGGDGGGGGGDKRRERRERVRQRRVGEVRKDKLEILKNVKGSLGEEVDDRTVEISSPFPGRESLLKKVLGVKKNRPFS